MKPPYAIGSVPSISGHAIAYRWRSLPRVRRHRARKPQGSSERVLPWQITMDQLIFASLSRTHYWYEVGMLKVPAVSPHGTRSPQGSFSNGCCLFRYHHGSTFVCVSSPPTHYTNFGTLIQWTCPIQTDLCVGGSAAADTGGEKTKANREARTIIKIIEQRWSEEHHVSSHHRVFGLSGLLRFVN